MSSPHTAELKRPGAPALVSALVSLSLAASAALAAAAPGSESRAPSDTLKKLVFLKEILVTGTRYPRAYFESPQALSFVSREQLREHALSVVGDALRDLPGVDDSEDSPWEQRPVVRGLTGQRVLVLMDGSPMNSVRGNGPHPSLVDPAQVERIEVVRGPSSVAYGSDALAGVINIITREAEFTGPGQMLRGSATIGGSTADRQRTGRLELMPRVGKLSAFLSGGARKAEDYESPNGKIPNSAFDDYDALANLRYDLAGHLALRAGYQFYRGQDIGVAGLNTAEPGYALRFSFPQYQRDAAHLALEHHSADRWLATSRVNLYWQREYRNFFSHEAMDKSLMGGSFPPPDVAAETRLTDQNRFLDLNTYGFQAQLASAKTRSYRLSAGVDAARDVTGGDNVRSRTFLDATGDPLGPASKLVTTSVPRGHFDNYGAFTQSEWYLDPRWTLSAGGRYTRYHYRTDAWASKPGFPRPGARHDDDALSGSLGLVYAPREDLHLSANVASAYREPNAQDLFFAGAASGQIYVFGNPDLKPEHCVSYDLGLRWGPGALALSGNLFYSTYRDLIDAVYVRNQPDLLAEAAPLTAYQYANISRARIWGGEAQGEWRFLSRWSVRAALAGAVGDITSRAAIQEVYQLAADRVPLTGVPPLKGSLALRWHDKQERFWVEPSARASWRTNRLPPEIPAVGEPSEFKKEWIAGDLFAGARVPSGQSLTLGVRNFTDRPYRQALSSVVEPGVSFVARLTTEF